MHSILFVASIQRENNLLSRKRKKKTKNARHYWGHPWHDMQNPNQSFNFEHLCAFHFRREQRNKKEIDRKIVKPA